MNVVKECGDNKVSILGPKRLGVEEKVFALAMINETTQHHSEPVTRVHARLRDRVMGGQGKGVGVINDQAHVVAGISSLHGGSVPCS